MKNWTIGKRIIFGFASIIGISAILGIFAYTRILSINKNSTEISDQSIPTFTNASLAKYNLTASTLAVFQTLTLTDQASIDVLKAKMAAITESQTKAMAALEALLTEPNEKALLEKVKANRPNYIKTRADLIAVGRPNAENEKAYNKAFQEFNGANDQYVKDLETLITYSQGEQQKATLNIVSAVTSSKVGILLGLGVALVVARREVWEEMTKVWETLPGFRRVSGCLEREFGGFADGLQTSFLGSAEPSSGVGRAGRRPRPATT